MKKKVLVLATTFPRWKNDSVPNFIYELAKEFLEHYEVHILTPHAKGSKRLEVMEGIIVHRFRYFIPKYENLSNGISISNTLKRKKLTLLLVPLFVFSGVLTFLRLNVKFKFEVVHNHWLLPFAPFVSFFKKVFNYKLILTSHGGDITAFNNSALLRKVFKYSVSNCNYYTVVSSDLAKIANQFIRKFDRQKLKIISMGIPYKEFSKVKTNFNEDNFTVVFVGRLSKIKGTKYLLKAISILKKSLKPIKCLIIGDGPERESLENLARELNIEKQTTFTGFIPHTKLPKKLNGCSAFVGPSITTESGQREGFGLVFIEAMAAGIPVIASRSGGIPDIVKHMKTGLLVEEGDSNKIAEYIEKIINNNKLRGKLISEGRKLAKNYSWESIGKRYLDLYEN